jgi:multidrug efflux pump subunit AcrA (membrane-fusion protein)
MFEMERQETTEFYHRRFGNFATIIIIPCGLLLLGIILFLCVAQHETTVVGNAEIIPEGHVQSVQSISNSRMTSNALAEGKHVKTGQLLVAYGDTRAQPASPVRATTTGIVHVNRDYQNMLYVPAGSELADDYAGY